MSGDMGASAEPTGLGAPKGAEPSGLGASPAIPSACRCGGSPIRIIVGGEPLCEEHRMSWISKEVRAAEEAHIRAVMKALDRVLEEPIGDDWNNHLRKLAIAAIEAGAV